MPIITHPSTGKRLTVDTFHVEPRVVLAWLKAHPQATAKDLSWLILDDARSMARMARESGGDAAHNNYALRILETALDWSLGLAFLKIVQMYRAQFQRLPKPFDLLATRKGAVLARFASGTVIEVLGA